jgi:hypothetical protein
MRRVLPALLGALAAAGVAALFWKELPALRRYIKVESM